MKTINNFHHVSFVGGAFSGKTSCVDYCAKHLAERFSNTDRKVTIFFAKEEATKVIEQNPAIDNKTLHFQFLVISGQLAAIHHAKEYAEQHSDEFVVLISDRSALDGVIYLNGEDQNAIGWEYLSHLYNKFLLLDCYIDPCNKGFVSDLKEGNIYRKEATVVDLINLSQKTKSFYLGTSIDPEKVTVIPSFESIEAKKVYVNDLLFNYIYKTMEG